MTFYQITCDGEVIYDPRSKDRIVLSPKLDLEVKKNGSLSFIIPQSNPGYDLIKLRKSVIKVYQITKKNGVLVKERLFRGVVFSSNKDFWKRKQVEVDGELSFFNDSIVRKYSYTGSVENYFKKLVNEHNQQVDSFKQFIPRNCTVVDSNNYITRGNENYPCTKTEMEDKLIDLLEGHFETEEIDGNVYIDYLAEYNKYNTQPIVFGRNMLDLSECISADNIATRLIGLGQKNEETRQYLKFDSINDGKDYVEDASAISLFGIITDTVNFENVTLASNLLTKTSQALQKRISETVTIELSAADLHNLDVDVDALRVGKMTRVISKPHNLDKYFLLSKMTINLDDPKSTQIILGSTFQTFTEREIQREKQAQQSLQNAVNTTNNELDAAKERVSNLIRSVQGGYVKIQDGELFIADNEDLEQAQKIWRWNLNGLGYSSTGLEGTYGLAMTMNGEIVADYITTGVLRSLQIINGNKFSVDTDGKVIAKDIEAEGVIKASSGQIAGFNLTQNGLQAEGVLISSDGGSIFPNLHTVYEDTPSGPEYADLVTTKGYSVDSAATVRHINMIGNGTGLNVAGYTTNFNLYASTSDPQLKKNIEPTEVNALDIINQIQHIQFNWKSNEKFQANGYNAQNLGKICEDFVDSVKQEHGEYKEILQVRDFNILPYITKAIQELSNKVQILEKENKDLKEAQNG